MRDLSEEQSGEKHVIFQAATGGRLADMEKKQYTARRAGKQKQFFRQAHEGGGLHWGNKGTPREEPGNKL